MSQWDFALDSAVQTWSPDRPDPIDPHGMALWQGSFTTTPEPTLTLLGTGLAELAGLMAVRRKRRMH